MSDYKICLTTTWNPRGEFPRFVRLLPQLETFYAHIVISFPPVADPQVVREFQDGFFSIQSNVVTLVNQDWSRGRYMALKKALEHDADIIHYADMDRILRWVETRPQELAQIVAALGGRDCLVIGRTRAAYETHPRAIRETEAISNQVISHLIGQTMDVSAGSKAFSRLAAEFLVENTRPGHALGVDGEWPVLLQRAGFRVDYLTVEGLDWESADRYQEQAADGQMQDSAAQIYDADPANWEARVQIAQEVVEFGIRAFHQAYQPLPSMISEPNTGDDFDFQAVFDVDDYLYFYADWLTAERSQSEVDQLVKLLALDEPCKILDLACGFGRHANRLAALGHQVTGVDLTPGFLDIARQEAHASGLQVDYRQADMREISFSQEFERVLLLFTAFGYFSDDENRRVLQNIADALSPGGLLIFDVPNRDVAMKGFQPAHVVEKDGNLMIDRQEFDSLTGRMFNNRIVIRDGERRDKPFFVRHYNPSEITALLASVGLKVERMMGSFVGEPVSTESRRMVIIARKLENKQ